MTEPISQREWERRADLSLRQSLERRHAPKPIKWYEVVGLTICFLMVLAALYVISLGLPAL